MLRAEGLCKTFGSLRVADDVSLSLDRGSRHGLIGPNGAGKTTLFNLLTGELRADRGTVHLDGVDLTGAPPDARARAGLARSFQRNNLFTGMSVRENLLIAHALNRGITPVFWRALARYSSLDREARHSAQMLGLCEQLDTVVDHLSYGTQRQVEIGLALAQRPKLLLLDEPTSGMSPEETAEMLRLLSALPSDLTLLIIEHDMDVLFGLAHQVTVLDYGKVLVEGNPEEVRASQAVRRRYLGGGG